MSTIKIKQVDYEELEKKLNYTFKNKKLLEQAITHTSYTNEHIKASHNEVLEFLGDSILQFISTRILFAEFQHCSEGELTQARSALVNTEALYELAEQLKLKEFIRVSRGHAKVLNVKYSKTVLANSIEAIISAIYLDSDIDTTQNFLLNTLLTKEKIKNAIEIEKDYKTKLQESIQETSNTIPNYKIIHSTGPDHDKSFIVSLTVGNKEIAKGRGQSRKLAEMDAARRGLLKYAGKVC